MLVAFIGFSCQFNAGWGQSFSLTVLNENDAVPIAGATVLLKEIRTPRMGHIKTNAAGVANCSGLCIKRGQSYSIEVTAKGFYTDEFVFNEEFNAEQLEQMYSSHNTLGVSLKRIPNVNDYSNLSLDQASMILGPSTQLDDLKGLSKKDLQSLLIQEVNGAKRALSGLLSQTSKLENIHQSDIQELTGYLDLGKSLRDSLNTLNSTKENLVAQNGNLAEANNNLEQHRDDLDLSLKSAIRAGICLLDIENRGEFDFGTSWAYPQPSFIPIGWSANGEFTFIQSLSDGYTEYNELTIQTLGMRGGKFQVIESKNFLLSEENSPVANLDEMLRGAHNFLWHVIRKFQISPTGIGVFQKVNDDCFCIQIDDLNESMVMENQEYGELYILHEQQQPRRSAAEQPGTYSTVLLKQDLSFWAPFVEMELESELVLLGIAYNPISDGGLLFARSSYGGGFEADTRHRLHIWYYTDSSFYGPISY